MKIVVSSSTVLNKKLLFLLARGEKKVKKEAKSRWGSISSYSLSLPPSCFQAATILPSPSPRLNAANYSSLLFLFRVFSREKKERLLPFLPRRRKRDSAKKRRGGGEKRPPFLLPSSFSWPWAKCERSVPLFLGNLRPRPHSNRLTRMSLPNSRPLCSASAP